LSRLQQASYNIHCFKPGKEIFKTLKSNAPADDRIKLNNFGLGKENCEAVLHYGERCDKCASLTKRDLRHYGINTVNSESVQLTTLDDYCMAHGNEHILLLKLDIEGHELDALQGSRKMITENRIDFANGNIPCDTFRLLDKDNGIQRGA